MKSITTIIRNEAFRTSAHLLNRDIEIISDRLENLTNNCQLRSIGSYHLSYLNFITPLELAKFLESKRAGVLVVNRDNYIPNGYTLIVNSKDNKSDSNSVLIKALDASIILRSQLIILVLITLLLVPSFVFGQEGMLTSKSIRFSDFNVTEQVQQKVESFVYNFHQDKTSDIIYNEMGQVVLHWDSELVRVPPVGKVVSVNITVKILIDRFNVQYKVTDAKFTIGNKQKEYFSLREDWPPADTRIQEVLVVFNNYISSHRHALSEFIGVEIEK